MSLSRRLKVLNIEFAVISFNLKAANPDWKVALEERVAVLEDTVSTLQETVASLQTARPLPRAKAGHAKKAGDAAKKAGDAAKTGDVDEAGDADDAGDADNDLAEEEVESGEFGQLSTMQATDEAINNFFKDPVKVYFVL